jgi:hypothetical protein
MVAGISTEGRLLPNHSIKEGADETRHVVDWVYSDDGRGLVRNVKGIGGAAAGGGSGGLTPATAGRFELVVVPNHPGSPFLLDTGTGCIWHQVQNQDTKRTFFIEVDVENLHWSWGSGAQGALASRIDGSTLTADQKNALKENLQRTGCGLSHVVLTPGPPQPVQKPESK